jgi:sterol desaturase/sphingolipid hydroxylase (fatty acid hydroxylase superfamily)
MHAILEYFGSLEHKPLDRLLFMAVPIALLWFLENAFPLVRMRYRQSKGKHALVNFLFTFFHLLIHAGMAVLLVMVCNWCQAHHFGLVHWLALGTWGIVVVGLLSMDFFGGWLAHIIEHKAKFLWRIHIVHHADNNVDVTTGLRHHPFEAVNRWLFLTFGVLLVGLPVYAVMLAQSFMSVSTMFTHANISLPERVDKTLSWIFVSPNMHKVHHHWKQPFTDSNYGTALSIWDHLLGTFMYLAPADIRYGLDRYYDNARDEEIAPLMKSPFDNWEKIQVAAPVDHNAPDDASAG